MGDRAELEFEWDDDNIRHLARHHITPKQFEEAMNNEPLFITAYTVRGEYRERVIGVTARGKLIWMVYAPKSDRLRPVTAFPAKRDRRYYLGKLKK